VFLSAFTMLAISVDRYRAVIFPLRPRLTTSKAAAVIVSTWMLAAVASLPVAVNARLTQVPAHNGDQRDFCDEVCLRRTISGLVGCVKVAVFQLALRVENVFRYTSLYLLMNRTGLGICKYKPCKWAYTVGVNRILLFIPFAQTPKASYRPQSTTRFRFHFVSARVSVNPPARRRLMPCRTSLFLTK